MLPRIVAGLIGVFFLLQGLNWLANPVAAAEGLGMPLLEGVGRSTQIGDLSGFFLCLGGMAIYGAWRVAPTFLRASGSLVGIVAVTRTIAWLAHDAPFTTTFIAVELITAGALFGAAARLSPGSPGGTEP